MAKTEINILIVDDDTSQRAALEEAVRRFGYRATSTAKVDEALNLVKLKNFHAAIIDCMLPRMNGVELAVKIRKGQFGSGVIILVSGVFKDKVFQTDALEKTRAVAFLGKPFSMDKLKSLLDESLAHLKDDGVVPLQVLVSKPFSSPRERVRVIESLEEINGKDVPFALSVLMDASASGFLNMVDGAGEVFGITLNKGLITRADSAESRQTTRDLLLSKGYVSAADLRECEEKAPRSDIVTWLVDEQILSPHVVPIIHREQMIMDLKRLFMNDKVQVSFAPERFKTSEPGWSADDLTPLLHDVALHVVTMEYLEEFYSQWEEYPIQVGPSFSEGHAIFTLEIFKKTPGLAPLLGQGKTMAEIGEAGSYLREDLYRALHLLVFRRLVIFDDVKKIKSVEEYGQRMQKMHLDLKGKNPFQVFEYFGLSAQPRSADVIRVFKEFSRNNHPDQLPPSAPEPVRDAVNRVFQIVSEAHAVLSDEERRQQLINSMDQQMAEVQIKAEAMADESLVLLSRGQAVEALARTSQAIKMHRSRSVILAHSWAMLKHPERSEKVAQEVTQLLAEISLEDRRHELYFFVSGLLKKELGDTPGALSAFDKALAINPQFLDARRERSATAGRKKEKTDIFNADLSQIVNNFFKKKG